MAKKTHYEVLGVAVTASAAAITTAFHGLALKHHPDRHQKNKKRAETKFKRISAAYNTLMDPAQRRTYDASLQRREIPRAKPKQSSHSAPPPRPRRDRRERPDRRREPTFAQAQTFATGMGGVYTKATGTDPHMKPGEIYSKTSKPRPEGCTCAYCTQARQWS